MSTNTALVIRATGAQGKGVVLHLVKAGWEVHALVNDPEEPRARAIQDMGATLHKGSLVDAASIQAAAKGCTAVFLNQMPSFTDDAETREAASLLSIAKAAGVGHVVHSTTLPLNDPNYRDTYEGNFAAPAIFGKADVETLVRDSGLTWTIIRPGWFMSNFLSPIASVMAPELVHGVLRVSFKPDTALPMIDPDDIGAFAVAAFQNPARFGGKIISLAGEKTGIYSVADEISRASGKQVKVVLRTDEETAEESKNNPIISGQVLSRKLDTLVDLEEARGWGIPFTSFRDFLAKHKDAIVPSIS
ncbi:NAD dependent epimerase/dehydratase [Polyplosphaeria fusca]|uniref:NAD dependent epimerase/dehydratase n=1 Tax=Polyplosphaeria fusca TaxID=682080 RepID=A0A9P4QPP9_9PLEO|nr:NAD dependent epimerase/dehydratase [Polyplosphaeria fusca]